ncbi:MAG: HAMP domain-containing histidine kinase [Planctomycetaceae bacterium]|nr:HAMP domain-containing histidine kinase [Planctomycetaceae bacterium]
MARRRPRDAGGLLPADWQTLLEQEKLAALAEFAAGAGHEINNPLSVIVGRAQILLRNEKHPDRRRDLAIIAAQAMRIHEMIADLMLFARPPEPQRAEHDLTALVRRAISELNPRAELQATTVELSPKSQPVSAAVDATQTTVAVRAIVDNALEALGHAGRIELSVTSLTKGRVPCGQIVVHDDGPGISEAVRRHLFDPFFSGRQAGRGLGNGLAKAWRIVNLHGGTITVDSVVGRGSTFTITLPISAKHSLLASTSSVAKKPSKSKAKPVTKRRGKSPRSRPG